MKIDTTRNADDRIPEEIVLEEFTQQLKKVHFKGVLEGAKVACETILEKIKDAKTDNEAIESVKKFCTASLNLHKAQEILDKDEREKES